MSAPHPPIGLLAELTHRCPLGCPYCSNPVDLTRAGGELETAEWRRVFSEAAALGVLQVHLSGGEPMVRKDLAALTESAARAGLYTNLITAGVLLDAERVARLAEGGLNHVQLSIQDSRADNADRIAGFAGGHARKLATARLVREADLPLTVNAVVHRGNLERVRELIDLALSMDADRLEIAHVQYHGWAYRNRAALIPTRDQVERAREVVEVARERLRGVLVIDYVEPDYYARYPKACMGGWARQFIAVTPAGRVLPCHAAESITGMAFDTVRECSLGWIWERSEAFERFRGTAWMEEPCRSCTRRTVDWGGCRCQAFALTGRAEATDPACVLSPHHDAMAAVADEEASETDASYIYRRFASD